MARRFHFLSAARKQVCVRACVRVSTALSGASLDVGGTKDERDRNKCNIASTLTLRQPDARRSCLYVAQDPRAPASCFRLSRFLHRRHR